MSCLRPDDGRRAEGKGRLDSWLEKQDEDVFMARIQVRITTHAALTAFILLAGVPWLLQRYHSFNGTIRDGQR